MNKPTHRKKLATVPSAGGSTEHKPRQKKNQPPKTAATKTVETVPTDAGWANEIIDATTGPQMQIVYTTTPNPTFSLGQQDDAQTNLISESTPITWLNNATVAGPTIQNNRIQAKPIIGKNSHLIIGDNNAAINNGPRRNFGVSVIEDITLDQLCNIEKSPQVTSSTHLVSDQTGIALPHNNSFSTSTGIIQTNVIGPTKPPKIQVTNQQILSNKLPIIKSLQSKGNVTLINKDGRMVIKTPTDPSGGFIQKTTPKGESKMDQLIKAVSLTTSPNSSTNQNSNKISLQKLQLVIPNKVRAATNMVKIFTSPQQLPSTPLKEKILLPVTQKPSLSGQENVVVLGVCQTTDNAMAASASVADSIDKSIHVITEDTPIDIISSDEIGKFDKQNNVPLKSTQLLKHLQSPIVKTPVGGKNRTARGASKGVKTIVVTDTIDVSDDNDVVSSTDWEMELDHANNCKSTDEAEQDNSVELTNVVEDAQGDPIESYFDDETDDIIQYDGKWMINFFIYFFDRGKFKTYNTVWRARLFVRKSRSNLQ